MAAVASSRASPVGNVPGAANGKAGYLGNVGKGGAGLRWWAAGKARRGKVEARGLDVESPQGGSRLRSLRCWLESHVSQSRGWAGRRRGVAINWREVWVKKWPE